MRIDKVSFAFVILAFMICLWSLVNVPITSFDDLKLVLVPILLVCGGLAIEEKLETKQRAVGQSTGESFSAKNMRWLGLALLGFFMSQFFVSFLPLKIVALTGVGTLLMADLYAISEEIFFRGAITSWLWYNTPPIVTVMFSGLTFMIYHYLVYGETNMQAWVYVLFCGVILAVVFIQNAPKFILASCIFAHLINNSIATLITIGYPQSEVLFLFIAVIILTLLSGFTRKDKGGKTNAG